jgi:hypothetical protein
MIEIFDVSDNQETMLLEKMIELKQNFRGGAFQDITDLSQYYLVKKIVSE